MRHLSQEELLMMADGAKLSPEAEAHVAMCSTCSEELERLEALLSAVAAKEEPPLDNRRLDEIAEGVMARVSRGAGGRRQGSWTKTWRPGAKWASAVALPLAAALVLCLLPRQEALSPRVYSNSALSSEDDLLSQNQWDLVWESLTADLPELSVLDQVSSVTRGAPYAEIRDLSNDELESLLYLLSGSDTS
jgi:hypothetical protein